MADNAVKRARLKATMKKGIIISFLLSALCFTGCGCHPTASTTKSPTEIDRKTFSMSLPDGWTEDTKDDMYEPDSFVFFENPESCLLTVIIGKKSAGMSIDLILEKEKEAYLKKCTDAKTSTFGQWSKYQGNGVEIDGKMGGTIKYRTRIFGFENGDNVCVIIEAATPGDLDKYADDFETIRQTFKLK
ncbi:MAG: hypothetical protein ACLQAH_07970 [Limisphaerales bacterium]